MTPTPVVACFLRAGATLLLRRRSDAARSHPGRWDAVSGTVDPADGAERPPLTAAHAAITAQTGLDASDVSLRRRGDRYEVRDADSDVVWRVHPFLFDAGTRPADNSAETADTEWVPAPRILRRDTVPQLWTAYDRVRPRVDTVRTDSESGSGAVSATALRVLRDEAALATAGRTHPDEQRECRGSDWEALTALARELRDARPSMAAVGNRINRVCVEAESARTAAAIETAAQERLRAALAADREAATTLAERLPARVATLSRSGTVRQALAAAVLEAVLVAESRPGAEGTAVAAALAGAEDALAGDSLPAVTLTSDAAFAHQLAAWEADALLVGADRVLPDGRVVNKAGTRAAALAAPSECPVFVVAARAKIAPDHTVDLEPRPADELYDGPAPVEVANPTFDVTPAAAVDAVVTEDGPLSPPEIQSIAAEHERWASRADGD
jgi:translation initiation factor 2B subunit (eIF-2B alpha/beta/delta family)